MAASVSSPKTSSPPPIPSSSNSSAAPPDHSAIAFDRPPFLFPPCRSRAAAAAGVVAAHSGECGIAPAVRCSRHHLWTPLPQRLLGHLYPERDCRIVRGDAPGARLG